MKTEQLRKIYSEFNLDKDDIFMLKFGKKEKPIITRGGIEKIQKQLGIQVKYEMQNLSQDHKHCVVLATGFIFGKNKDVAVNGQQPKPKHILASFGEASPANNTNSYPVAMAEKRAKSRVVLQMSGLYEMGVMGEDESEDFKKQ